MATVQSLACIAFRPEALDVHGLAKRLNMQTAPGQIYLDFHSGFKKSVYETWTKSFKKHNSFYQNKIQFYQRYRIMHSASELAGQEIEIENNWQCAKWAKKNTK